MSDQRPTYEANIIRARTLGQDDAPPSLVTLNLTPQWAELVRQLQTMRNGRAVVAVIKLRELEVGCVVDFEATRTL